MYCKEVSTPHLCTTARMLTNVFDEITESNPYFNKTFPKYILVKDNINEKKDEGNAQDTSFTSIAFVK